MIIEWAGQKWIARSVTVGEWWTWCNDVSSRVIEGDAEWPAYAAQWCARVLEVPAERMEKFFELAVDYSTIELGNSLLKASEMPTARLVGLSAYYDVVEEATKYVASEEVGVCGCPECIDPSSGPSKYCAFRNEKITESARLMGLIQPEVVAQFWDKPLALFQQHRIYQGAKARGIMARKQAGKRKKEREELRDAILSRHGIH